MQRRSNATPSRADAKLAYPGYTKQRKRMEATLRRTKLGVSATQRAFACVMRVVLAVALLPYDLLLSDAVRRGNLSRPFVGVLGASLAYAVFHGASTMGPNGGRVQQRLDPDLKRVYHPLEIPHWLNPCNLDPFPGSAAACPRHRRRDEGRRVHSEDGIEVTEHDDNVRVLRVDGITHASIDTRNGRLEQEHARAAVRVAAEWRRPVAGGERATRVLVLGLGGAVATGVHSACRARSAARHRRAVNGVSGCVITAVESNPRAVRVAESFFVGVVASAEDASRESPEVRFVVDDAASYVADVATPGGFDVVLHDASDENGDVPAVMKTDGFYRTVRRALSAGGVYVTTARAPAFGPGLGRENLAAVQASARAAFGEDNVETRRTGPFVPIFSQVHMVVATKKLDEKLAEYHNWS